MKLLHHSFAKDLNIILWKLRYPILLTNKKPIHLLIKLKLLIISDINISPNDNFIEDVTRSMRLNQTEIYIITIDQIHTLILPKKFLNYCWWLGVKVLYNYHCLTFNTPSLSILKCNIHAKRDLWNQINLFLRNLY